MTVFTVVTTKGERFSDLTLSGAISLMQGEAEGDYDYTETAEIADPMPVGSPEEATAHFAMDKAEVAIDTDQPDEARRLLRTAILAYADVVDPIARANAANRQARIAARWMDRYHS
jgi:hypothetical protein